MTVNRLARLENYATLRLTLSGGAAMAIDDQDQVAADR
jgi:hypothetical protein